MNNKNVNNSFLTNVKKEPFPKETALFNFYKDAKTYIF